MMVTASEKLQVKRVLLSAELLQSMQEALGSIPSVVGGGGGRRRKQRLLGEKKTSHQ
jgi:hypothetical protein